MLKFIYHVICFLLFYPIVNCQNKTIETNKDKALCASMLIKYSIKPGKSFGTLPTNLHDTYLNLKCYRFFCAPNPLGYNL